MSWRLEVRPEVETDLAAAALWYEMQQPELGTRFLDEVETALWYEMQQPGLGTRFWMRSKPSGNV